MNAADRRVLHVHVCPSADRRIADYRRQNSSYLPPSNVTLEGGSMWDILEHSSIQDSAFITHCINVSMFDITVRVASAHRSHLGGTSRKPVLGVGLICMQWLLGTDHQTNLRKRRGCQQTAISLDINQTKISIGATQYFKICLHRSRESTNEPNIRQ